MSKRLDWNFINSFNHFLELNAYITSLPLMVYRRNEKMNCTLCESNNSYHQMRMTRLYCSSKSCSDIGICDYQLKTLTCLNNSLQNR